MELIIVIIFIALAYQILTFPVLFYKDRVGSMIYDESAKISKQIDNIKSEIESLDSKSTYFKKKIDSFTNEG